MKEKEWLMALVCQPVTGLAMLKPAVTLPAHALRIDFFNRGFVAADAVGLHHFLPMIRERDGFRYRSGIKHQRVFHAVNGLPDVIGADILVWKVTVDAFDAPVRPGVKPGFKLGLHDVAGSTEVRRLCFGHEFWGAEHHEKTPGCGQDNNREDDLG